MTAVVSVWIGPKQKSSVFAILAPHPYLKPVWFAGRNAFIVCAQNLFQIVRMNNLVSLRIRRCRIRPFVTRQTVIFECSLVYEKRSAVRTHYCDMLRNGVDQFLQVLFLLQHRFFSSLAVFD